MCKLKVINGNGKYKDEDSRVDVINYILRKDRAIHGHWGGSHIDLQFPIAAMEAHADSWNKNSGVRIRHFVLSFSHEEVSSPEFAKKIGQLLANHLGHEYQTIFAVHENTDHLHIHFVMNAISHDGKRYRGTKCEFYSLMNYLKRSLKRYGIRSVQYLYVTDID